MIPLKKLIAVVGATGTGKSGLAIKLAKKFHGEIVNADSRQVYRGMDIGTAKPSLSVIPSAAEGTRFVMVEGIPHHCFDMVNPDEPFTLADWKREALKAINDIHAHGNIPFLVGGTGLYFQAIVANLDIPEVPPNPVLRQELGRKSLIELWRALEDQDPETAKTIDHFNKRRMVRALEVIGATGQKFSDLRRRGAPLFEVLEIGIDPVAFEIASVAPLPRNGNKKASIASARPPRYAKRCGRGAKQSLKGLYDRIDARVDQMVRHGLLDEVRRLAATYPPNLPAMSSIGYRELTPLSVIPSAAEGSRLEEAVQKMKFRTHALARRQLTWFRRDQAIHWVKTDEEAEALVSDFLPSLRGD